MTSTATLQKDTRTQILDVAERLVQTRGFNDFSYADIASELAVTNAALHYHFRTKAALGDALIERYSERFFAALDRIAAGPSDARAQIEAYIDLYREVLAADRMCLCGVLAAEYPTLPGSMRAAVQRFFDRNETWLVALLETGSRSHRLDSAGSARDTARMIVDTLEGAVMIARAQHDPDRFRAVATRLLRMLHAG
ncbi:TetR/AcrR family transcriptional regulator [Amnibacterium sp.]|uniref:TetR/AcrR family transcriptional regulator n=1 Tax=Amnibacterium sp. TaxID=1872496 RepID=UPI0026176994|nr:TetR/AcrR family transcriptional regulator [Amnibacterium sp.]MCU1472429.1 regulatory protein TetR [Amnibacterium sp.]